MGIFSSHKGAKVSKAEGLHDMSIVIRVHYLCNADSIMLGLASLCRFGLLLCFVVTFTFGVPSLQASTKVSPAGTNSLDDVSHFNCKDKPRISRFPDVRDCSRFIYCIAGAPHSGKCWRDGSEFNPATGRCDLVPNAVSTCKRTLGVRPIVGPTTTSTTVRTTTTTRRPPLLAEKFSFDLDCGKKHPCGIYPNHNGDCTTFLLCDGDGPPPKVKRCHGGQHFDVDLKECRPANESTCWKAPSSGPIVRRPKPPPLCPTHPFISNLPSLKPINTNNNATSGEDVNDDGIGGVLTSPDVTHWGQWRHWQHCSKGSFIVGINAWRRLLQQGQKMDHAGLISLGVQCQNPDGVVTNVLENVSPNAPNDGFSTFYPCNGVAVGFRLNSLPPITGDNLGTDNIQLLCSCGPPVHKPYETFTGPQSGNRGIWTEPQVCRKKTALCGVQAQMDEYKEAVIGVFDNTGVNNIRMECCPVPDPLDACTPTESLMHLRSCSNTDKRNIYPKECRFEATTGVSYNFDDPRFLRRINFHQSVGYEMNNNVTQRLKMKFQDAFENGTLEVNSRFPWNEGSNVWQLLDMANASTPTWKESQLYLNTNTSVELFQIVGACGHFIVKTNRFIRMDTSYGRFNTTRTESMFEI